MNICIERDNQKQWKYTNKTKTVNNVFSQLDVHKEGRWWVVPTDLIYRQTSTISRTFTGNENVDHSDVVGASPVGVAPTTTSFST